MNQDITVEIAKQHTRTFKLLGQSLRDIQAAHMRLGVPAVPDHDKLVFVPVNLQYCTGKAQVDLIKHVVKPDMFVIDGEPAPLNLVLVHDHANPLKIGLFIDGERIAWYDLAGEGKQTYSIETLGVRAMG